mmetsp:Transcript_10994/g.26984  ORF Transcript_10994/g.26984 Transcript_10994/m.26984 type:complete len:252 (+) Transcript_10994:1182-1937(+)
MLSWETVLKLPSSWMRTSSVVMVVRLVTLSPAPCEIASFVPRATTTGKETFHATLHPLCSSNFAKSKCDAPWLRYTASQAQVVSCSSMYVPGLPRQRIVSCCFMKTTPEPPLWHALLLSLTVPPSTDSLSVLSLLATAASMMMTPPPPAPPPSLPGAPSATIRPRPSRIPLRSEATIWMVPPAPPPEPLVAGVSPEASTRPSTSTDWPAWITTIPPPCPPGPGEDRVLSGAPLPPKAIVVIGIPNAKPTLL